ncbi:MAG: cell division topological specificity factor MinE [Chloroflexota bacterium]|nr:cell division topological specificity factor MinE [Chloroflexota bacterium]
MAGFLERMFGRAPKQGTGITAKERLQFILVHDRINLPPERLEMMKKEILEVISKYVEVDGSGIDIALQKRQRDSLLVAEIPFSRPSEGFDQDEDEDSAQAEDKP